MSLKEKIDLAVAKIQKMESTAIRYDNRGFVVAFSGGKDSQVVLRLAQMAEVRYQAVHSLTTIDPPESVKFIRSCYPEVEIIRPELSFSQLVRKKQMLPSRQRRYCCQYLKENYGAGRVVLTGVRRQESLKRKNRTEIAIRTRRRHPEWTEGDEESFYNFQETQVQCLNGQDKLVMNPILEWSDRDVWSFIELESLPHNPVYSMGCSRLGCVMCPLSSIRDKRQEMKMWPKIAQRWFRIFKADREYYLRKTGNDKWYGLSDTEAFSCYLNETSPDRSMSIPFENDA